jgi:ABC-2 type transport system permease protein
VTEASAQAAGPRPKGARGAQPALGPTLAALLEVDFSVQLRNYRSLMLSLLLPVVVLVAFFANKRAAALADPGVRISLVMILGMATIAIFGYALTVARDRDAGVFQRLRVTPAPAWAIMMSRLVVQVAVILLMAIVVLIVARIFQNVTLDPLAYGLTLAVVVAGSAVFLGIGQALVGLVGSADTLNAVSRLVYIPLFGLGVLGRTDILGSTVEDIARWSPGGIVVTLLAAAMEPATWGSDAWWSLLACLGYSAVFVFLGIRWFQWGAH